MEFNRSTYSSMADQRAGRWHAPFSAEIVEQIDKTADLVFEYNRTPPGEKEKLRRLLGEILHPDSAEAVVRQPMTIEYGCNTLLSEGVFINYGVTILDSAEVRIGAGTMIGPNCQLITVTHPVDDHEMRAGGWEIAKPITIGENVWLGTAVTVLPGVSIGDNAVVGARAVVTRDVPAGAVVVGSPARVVRYAGDSPLERAELPEGVPLNVFEEP